MFRYIFIAICFFPFWGRGAFALDSRHHLSASLGAKNVEVGLHVPSVGDGVNNPIIVGVTSARQVAYPQSKYMYVVVNQADGTTTTGPENLYVIVEASSNARDLEIEYDRNSAQPSLATKYTRATQPITISDNGEWHKLCFYLPAARLQHGQNFGADFRLCENPRLTGKDIAIHSIEVATTRPSGNFLQSVSVRTLDGSSLICNPSAAFSQIPGRPDLFIGRCFDTGSIDDCHKPHQQQPCLALFKMDWEHHILFMQNYLLDRPGKGNLKTPAGFSISSTYDPCVATYQGEVWVAFECLAPGAVCTGIAPLTRDFKHIDLTRLTVPVKGILGEHGLNKQIVCVKSASAPTLLNYRGKMFLYWQVDYFDNQVAGNLLITRGAELEKDSKGRLWAVGSGQKPVMTDDERLTFLAHDVNPFDSTKNHVACISDLKVVGGKVLAISSIGGTAGEQVCRSTHDISPGCWRISLSIADSPVGANVFGRHELDSAGLAANTVEYPRLVVDQDGRWYLLGNFVDTKCPPIASERRILYGGRTVGLIPFDWEKYLR